MNRNPTAARLGLDQSSGTDRRAKGLDAKSDGPDNGEGNEKPQRKELREQEGGLGLRGSHLLQDRHLLEDLNDQDEDIEIERHHSANNVDPAPGAGEVEGVAR